MEKGEGDRDEEIALTAGYLYIRRREKELDEYESLLFSEDFDEDEATEAEEPAEEPAAE